MKTPKDNVSRRDFGKLALAAFGGVMAGSVLSSKLVSAAEKAMPKADAHACCGLNACKGQGGCATTEAHSCSGSNACKGQGGTADNACKGKGSCSVPIKGDGWKKARAHYEASMTKAGKKFGASPATCGS
jgi:hypothetical protein